MLKLLHTLISHASKVMLTILQARLQQYVNRELPDVQTGFRKGRGTRDQIANIHWIIKKAREFQKNIYFCFIAYAKAFDCVDHNKLWEILNTHALSCQHVDPCTCACVIAPLSRHRSLGVSTYPGCASVCICTHAAWKGARA